MPHTPVVGSFAQHGFTLFADMSANGAQQALAAGGLAADVGSFLVPYLATRRAGILVSQAASLPNLLGASKANLLFRARTLGFLDNTLNVTSNIDFFASQVPKSLPHIKQTWSNVDVGGILFNKSADVLTNVAEIVGAYWDTKTDSLVLIGKAKQKSELVSMGLPSMDQDHLLVALRASIAGQPIGVSIDPPSEYRDGIKRGVNPPDGTPMLVSYLGGTENTLFGAIMFEADRLLKCLDKGVHNETKKPIRATVHGFNCSPSSPDRICS